MLYEMYITATVEGGEGSAAKNIKVSLIHSEQAMGDNHQSAI